MDTCDNFRVAHVQLSLHESELACDGAHAAQSLRVFAVEAN